MGNTDVNSKVDKNWFIGPRFQRVTHTSTNIRSLPLSSQESRCLHTAPSSPGPPSLPVNTTTHMRYKSILLQQNWTSHLQNLIQLKYTSTTNASAATAWKGLRTITNYKPKAPNSPNRCCLAEKLPLLSFRTFSHSALVTLPVSAPVTLGLSPHPSPTLNSREQNKVTLPYPSPLNSYVGCAQTAKSSLVQTRHEAILSPAARFEQMVRRDSLAPAGFQQRGTNWAAQTRFKYLKFERLSRHICQSGKLCFGQMTSSVTANVLCECTFPLDDWAPHKAPRPDGISPTTFRHCAGQLNPVLMDIFNTYFN